MLDSLPTELVEHVVRLAVSSSFLPHLYHDRLATLTSLSLTSSKLRIVAQPILLEVVQLKSREAVESFLAVVEADKALGARARSVRVEGFRLRTTMQSFGVVDVDFKRLSSSCPRIVDFRVHWQDLDLEWLEGFNDLRRLVFSDGYISACRPLSFSHLEELSLAQPALIDQIFITTAFPALKALHAELVQGANLPPIPSSLLAQLEQLSCDWSDLDDDVRSEALMTAPQTRILADNADLNGDPSQRSLVLATTLHLNKYSCSSRDAATYDPDTSISMLNGLLRVNDSVNERILKLSALYLPSELDPSSPLCDLRGALLSDLHRCLSALPSRSIEVVFEEAPHPFYESLISKEIWRRSKARKAKEEQELEGKKKGGAVTQAMCIL
ncbi:hypothetical protein JCM8547_008646 [Rhodosporidiobolus lusitaniae]